MLAGVLSAEPHFLQMAEDGLAFSKNFQITLLFSPWLFMLNGTARGRYTGGESRACDDHGDDGDDRQIGYG